MARIFISYSHRNMTFKNQFVAWLRQHYPDHVVRDDTHLRGGENWWPKVLQEVATCDVFIFLVSNKSLKSNFCRQEFAQAVNQGKRILPILIHGNINWSLAGEIGPLLKQIQWVNLSKGINDASGVVLLYSSLQNLFAGGDKPKETSGTFNVADVNAGFANVGGKVFVKDDLIINYPTPPQNNDPVWYRDPAVIAPIVAGFIGSLLLTLLSLTPFFVDRAERASATQTALVGTRLALSAGTATDAPLVAPTNIPTRSIEELLGETQTVDARTFAETQAALNFQAQVAAAATATAEAPTLQAQFEATLIAAGTATRQYYLAQTPSATPIPPTLTPTNTPTNTPIPPTNTPVPPTATPDPLAIARTPVIRNADWTPVVQDFDGVPMVLVPAGCFMMGSNDGQDDERNGNEICFSDPFWLDQTEVTQADFTRLGGVKANGNAFSGNERPVERITWFEARDFCDLRGMRLPTEAEWEYAARGPDELIYPWGNTFVADNMIYNENSNSQTANVGSRPAGASWVGAFDLSGNVWEWTATLYQNYPYSETDGRNNNDNRTSVRVLRGGSWGNYGNLVRSANRYGNVPAGPINYIGFRCVRPLL
jgi:formylglycine-generating enzyme required for sulfatase activity